jgi:acetyl-CoA synthetase
MADRHGDPGRIALHWLGKDGRARDVSFDELGEATGRFANLIHALGVRQGDRVAGYMPRVPETLIAMLGTWRLGAVYVPIFTGFGPEAIAYRVEHSGARVLCTHRDHRQGVPAPLPGGTRIVTARRQGGDDLDFDSALAVQPDRFDPAPLRRSDPAVLLYTSGSTGPPKGVQIAANFPLAVRPYVRYGVDLRHDDVFWPNGDPGGATVSCDYMKERRFHDAAPARPLPAIERGDDGRIQPVALG